MKILIYINKVFAMFSIAILFTINLNAQTSRRDTKKSVAYRANYQRMASGPDANHVLEIRNGTLWAWGFNNKGQIGDSSTTNRIRAVQIGFDNKWVIVSVGANNSFGIKSDGTLWAWGDNSKGQLGDGTKTNRISPVQIGTDSLWISIVAGSQHSLGLKSDGTLWAWGYNVYGQLGNGTTNDQISPVQIGTDNKWISIATGSQHAIGIKSDGTLWSWGNNSDGQLGDSTLTSQNKPIQIGKDNMWVSITAGNVHTLGLKSDGTIWAWGDNSSGQLGDGTTNDRIIPTRIGNDNKWVTISSGNSHTLALKANGTFWAWGSNVYGALGDGTTSNRYSPTQIGKDKKWVAISAGQNHSIGLKSDGTLWTMGYNNYGQLGDSTTNNYKSPIQTSKALSVWLSITESLWYGHGLKSDGTLWAWGGGLLGDGVFSNHIWPIQIGTGNNWISVSASNGRSIGIKSDGTLWAWGYNKYGYLGDGTYTDRMTPVQIGKDSIWVSVSVGDFHNLALKSDGTLWAWGHNNSGELGDSSRSDKIIPVQIGKDTKWVSIAAGIYYSLGLKSDGSRWAWGTDTYGPFGIGGAGLILKPFKTGTDNKWISIAAGLSHSLGLKSDGSLWAAGINNDGQLGDGTFTMRTSFVQTGTDNTWIGISASRTHSLALKSSGGLWVWGDNSDGQIGYGTKSFRTTPLKIGKENVWISIDASDYQSLGLKADRKLFCGTGINSYGELGDGTKIDRTSFVCHTNCTPPAAPLAIGTKICYGQIATIIAKGNGKLGWYSDSTGGKFLGSDSIFKSPKLTNNTIYYVQDSVNCPSLKRTKVLVIVNPLHFVFATASDTIVCQGTLVMLKGRGAKTYSWTGGITDSVAFISKSTFIYSVLGKDSNNCSDTASIKIRVNQLPKITATANVNIVCAGTIVILNGKGAKTYKWTGGITNNVGFIPTSTAKYLATGTDSNNCSDTSSIIITVKPLPTLKLINPQKYCCDYGNVALGSSTFGSPTSGSWSCRQSSSYISSNTFQTGQACDPNKSKTYTLIYTYQDPTTTCINKDSTQFTIHSLPKIIAKASDTSVCEGTKVTLYGEGGISYTWSGGVKNGVPFIPSKINTSYFLEGKDTTNCYNRDTIKLFVNSLPDVATNLNGVTISSNQNGATYQWLDCKKSYAPISGETKQSYKATKNGDYAVIVTKNGCSDTSACVTINTIGINNIASDNYLRVYPNPNNGSFNIQSTGEGSYSIVNELGQTIKMLELNSSNKYTITIENIGCGIYFIVGLNNNQIIRQKVVVVK